MLDKFDRQSQHLFLAEGAVPSFGAAIIEKFFLLPNWENVNIFYIIGRPAMMGKADRLPP